MSTFLSAAARALHDLCALGVLCAVVFCALPAHAVGEPRVALVVGNARYEDSPLANPVNDATDMAKELTRLGFAVTLRTNQNADQLKELISEFGDALARSKGVGLFYFAGHGVQVDGRNYLLPVGRRYRREKDVELFAVESRAVLARMDEAGNPLNIVILDACRDSPLPPESRSAGSRGLARDTAPSGALIAYATAPGSTADDRPGARNGLYTGHLLQALREPGLRLEDVFGRVREAVELDSTRSRSGVQQSPEEVSRLRGKPFYFMPPVASAGGAPFVSTPVAPPAPRPEPVAPPGPRVGDVFRDCAECPEMVVLPAGSFEMGDLHGDGDADEKPVRTVRIAQPFAMGKYEVTQGQWRAVMGSNPSHFKDCGDGCPVERVSWEEVQAFIVKLNVKTGKGYRLPSEAEWEYACRAGGRHKWCGGDDLDAVAWYDKNSGSKTHAVGRKGANGWGLHDMSGNVWEWVQDCSEESYNKGQPVDGRAHESSNNCARRVNRGGGWDFLPANARSASRGWDTPGDRGNDLGFRLSRTLP